MKKLDELIFDRHPMATLAAIIFAVAMFVMVSGPAQAHDMCRFTNQNQVRLLHDIDADIRQGHVKKARVKSWILYREHKATRNSLKSVSDHLHWLLLRDKSGDRQAARGMIEGILILLGEGLSQYKKNCGR